MASSRRPTKVACLACLACLALLLLLVQTSARHPSKYRRQSAVAHAVVPRSLPRRSQNDARLGAMRQEAALVTHPANSVAAFTIVRNEAFFLPIWLRYYGRHFSANDMYVLDNGSTDGSTQSIPAHVVSRPSRYFNDLDWLRRTVTEFQAHLLQTGYNYVLFAEVDELVVARWPGGLKQYVAQYRRVSASVTGYEVVHDIFQEDDIDPGRLILEQRKSAVRVPWWDKPLLTSVPLTYCKGFHVCLNGCYAPRDDVLLLFHLDRADFKVCYDRLTAKATKERFHPHEEKNQGVQQHYTGRMAAAYCLNVTAQGEQAPIVEVAGRSDIF